MSRKKFTVWALAAAMLLSVAPAAEAHGNHGATYGSHWHGNTYYGAGHHVRGSVDAQLFVATANGDFYAVKKLVERGANVDARDIEGLTPLSWAAQHGRTEIAKYLITQHANLNPADKFGFTPLMWAAQEGQQGMVNLLLSKGANPRVVTRNGVSAASLARYAGHWRTASMLEDRIAGRRPAVAVRTAPRAVVPVRVTAAASAPAAPAAEAARAPQEPGMLAKALAFKKLAENGKIFSDDYMAYVKVATSGGFSLNALQAATSPDMETGKLLTVFFANVARSQDLKAARADLDKAKASLNGKADARFARYVVDADKALTEVGF